MPVYKITLVLRSGSPPYPLSTRSVIREFASQDLDAVWHKLTLKCEEKWGRDLKNFDCVMISKRSPEYRSFLKQKEAKKNPRHVTSFPGSNQNLRGSADHDLNNQNYSF